MTIQNKVPYGVKYWFNDICRLWGTIKDDKGKKVESYLLEKVPDSVTKVPCAISYLTGDIDANVSLGGPETVVYHGKTDFHLTLSLVRSGLPYVMSFPDKIIQAAPSSITLDGKVVSFRLSQPGSVRLVQLTWGNEEEHYGIEVPWIVQENQSGKYTVSV